MAELSVLSSPIRKSKEELALEHMSDRLISLSAKIALMILDPKRRPPLPKREAVINFLETINAAAEGNIKNNRA